MSKFSKSIKRLKLVENGQDPFELKLVEEPVKPKPAKSAKSAKSAKPAKIGSARGIETMFRTSYRAQLDMIALAATKANIMISLNGVLVSVLLISGAYFLSSDPLLLIPVSLFLLTCTIAITFAVLAARPDVNNSVQTLDDFKADKAHLLIFDEFTCLSSEEFTNSMLDMMQNNERVYGNMTAHIYNLGCVAKKKFDRLHISYTAFFSGLIVSVTSLIAVIIYHSVTTI